MTDQRIWELAGLNIGYDRAVRPLEFARAIEREVLATRTQGADMADAYVGARDGLEDWKRRALEAEDLNRKFMREINGPTHMGEPVIADDAQPVASDEPEIDPVKALCYYADGMCGILRKHGYAGKAEALESRIREAMLATLDAAPRDAQDAQRYRWIRLDRTEDQTRQVLDIIIDNCEENMDEAIDKAIAASTPRDKS